jgi:23S rRNA pseudouridine1911/1915/1917 synthase
MRRRFRRRPSVLPDPGADVALVHVDEALAVVDKPAGLVVHAAPGHRGETLVSVLGELLGGGEDPVRPGIVHRLDRDTSGLMLVARTDEAHRALAAAIKAREVRREYLALVGGRPRSRSGTIDAPLGRDYRAPERRAVGGRGARDARTHFEVVEAVGGDTLVRVRLETGRTHQIRAHFAAIGHPVAGDPRYGGAGRHGLARQFLHSARLGFTHPNTGENVEFDSELPEDLLKALEQARG